MSTAKSNLGEFSLQRTATVAIAVTLFILLFRPFGMTINSFAEYVVVLGLAPLNFGMMLLVHLTPSRSRWIGAAQRISAIIFGNIIYLSVLSGERVAVATSIKVILVALLVVAAAGLWNRERSLRREVLELRARSVGDRLEMIILRGESDKEILRLAPDALRYVCANGNYVDVHFMKGAEPDKALLRTTLAGIADQAPDGALHQCHRSYLVNLATAQRLISARGAMDIEFSDGARVPVSRSFRKAIRAAAAS